MKKEEDGEVIHKDRKEDTAADYCYYYCEQGIVLRKKTKNVDKEEAPKWPKSDSKATPGVPPQGGPKWHKNDSKIRSGVTFESILGHSLKTVTSLNKEVRRLKFHFS